MDFRAAPWLDFSADPLHLLLFLVIINIMETPNTHSMPIGYLYWIFGFTGAHRFFYGRPITGTIWFFTFGLLGIGWLIDAFLIPGMDRKADRKYAQGSLNYSLSWVLLTFFGVFGLHRFYMGKWITGLIYFLTGGLFLFGYLYDLWTLNSQLSDLNAKEQLTGSR